MACLGIFIFAQHIITLEATANSTICFFESPLLQIVSSASAVSITVSINVGAVVGVWIDGLSAILEVIPRVRCNTCLKRTYSANPLKTLKITNPKNTTLAIVSNVQ
jgi:hypothetical protein